MPTFHFLFSDIEGSTRLWEAHPETMQTALAKHDQQIRTAIEDQGAEPTMPWVGLIVAVVALGAVTGLASVRGVMNRARLTFRQFRTSVIRRPAFGDLWPGRVDRFLFRHSPT